MESASFQTRTKQNVIHEFVNYFMEEIYLINSSNIPNSFSRSEIKNGVIALVQHKHLTNWKCNLEDQHWKNCQTNERVSSNLPSKNPISLSKSEITAGNYSSNLGGRMGCQMEERRGRTWVDHGWKLKMEERAET